jgi:hypothetical protein
VNARVPAIAWRGPTPGGKAAVESSETFEGVDQRRPAPGPQSGSRTPEGGVRELLSRSRGVMRLRSNHADAKKGQTALNNCARIQVRQPGQGSDGRWHVLFRWLLERSALTGLTDERYEKNG